MWVALSDLFMHRMDDLIYAELLCISAVCSMLMRYISVGPIREILGALIGVCMVYHFTGVKVLYSLVTVIVNIVICLSVRTRYLALSSFVFTFLYLGFLRAIHLFGLPALVSHANAVQLIMTLRLVGLSFEIQDARNKKGKVVAEKERFIQEPTWLQMFFYAYYFPGLFTGPYYTYAMHQDVINNDSIMGVSVWSHIKWRIYNLLWACPAFILLVYIFPLDRMRQEEFFDETIFYKIYVSIFVFFWMRCRVYSAWMVSESVCVLNGIGLYPESTQPRAGHGPTLTKELKERMEDEDVVFTSEAVRNLDIKQIEFESTFRGGMRAWNRSVQYWLAAYVYKRVPRAFGMVLTMSVSAFWHGIHPGYYLSFLSIPLCTFAEDMITSIIPKDANGKQPFLYTAAWYIVRQLGFAYLASGFLLLTYKDTIRYWESVHFYIHWLLGAVICFAWLYKAIHLTAETDKKMKIGKANMKMSRAVNGTLRETYADDAQAFVKDSPETKKEL